MDLIRGPGGDILARGGPVLWLIAVLSVLTLALIFWRLWRYLRMGAWAGSDVDPAVAAWVDTYLVEFDEYCTGRPPA